MATRIHPKNVYEKSPKNVHEMSPKKRTSRGQKCPRNVTKCVHEMSPIMSTRCLPPLIKEEIIDLEEEITKAKLYYKEHKKQK